tara:strand:+ start:10425 stop:11297 length:873 start_codon:yes stop_codon:yes gene_type:complete
MKIPVIYIDREGNAILPIHGALGGGDVNVPGPSSEERALQAEQTELLRDQRDILNEQVRQQNLLAPFLFSESGVQPIFNEIDPETGELQDPLLDKGDIIAFEPIDDPLDPLRGDIERQFLERTNLALKGELPTSPALERELAEGEQQTRERLLKQLGPGFETSTPGIEGLDTFFRTAEELREGARRGDLTLAEQLGLAREQQNQSRIDALIGRLTGVANVNTGNVQGGLGLASGFGDVVGQFQQNRALELQGNIASVQARSSTLGALFGAIGSGLGLAAGGGFFGKGFGR